MAWPASARSGPFHAILRYNQEPTRPLGGLESSYWGQMGVPWEWLTQGWVQLPQRVRSGAKAEQAFLSCMFYPRMPIQLFLSLLSPGGA